MGMGAPTIGPHGMMVPQMYGITPGSSPASAIQIADPSPTVTGNAAAARPLFGGNETIVPVSAVGPWQGAYG